METALIRTKSKKDLQLLLNLAKKIGIDTRRLTPTETEELGLVNAIKKGATGKTVNTKSFLKKLRQE